MTQTPEISSEDYHIHVGESLGGGSTRILKHDDLFGVFNGRGDVIGRKRTDPQGIYLSDTRHLNHQQLRICDRLPLLLSSTVNEENALLSVDLTNPDLDYDGQVIPADTIHILREKFMLGQSCFEQISLFNYADRAYTCPVQLTFGSDFADIFEVRGSERAERGQLHPPRADDRRLLYSYEGLDGAERTTEIRLEPAARLVDEHTVVYELTLPPRQPVSVTISLTCATDIAGSTDPVEPGSYYDELARLSDTMERAQQGCCQVETSNQTFNHWIGRSHADLQMLATRTDHGVYPYAGTPWFSTVFGRDGLITAAQMIWIDSAMARGVLSYLAEHQADQEVAEQDAEPGKILHETRRGEMARLGEVPFRHYYGSIDATPLFVLLAGLYFRQTGDTGFIEELWPSIRAAVDWIDEYGDRDGDGYVEYATRARGGLVHQGWKDSEDSVFHADGSAAEGPIALCEVQAYVYGARRAAAAIGEAVGEEEFARRQREAAGQLRDRFERDFWSEDLQTYVLALDGEKQPCEVRSSNAGHCLLTGIASAERAERVADALMGETFYSGWGIRTVPTDAPRFNPLSYHNGSIWPHDNALIAAGFARYGFRERAVRLLDDFGRAASYFDLHRLPELFCGFRRRGGQGPTLYPVACSPQAWAAGAVFMFLKAALGLDIDGRSGTVTLREPRLPASLPELRLRNLTVGDGSLDLRLQRYPSDVGIEVVERTGDVELRVAK